MVRAEHLDIEVVYSSGPGHSELVRLRVVNGTSLNDAVLASGLISLYGLQPESLRLGIWGKVKDGATVLRQRDRVEIYRVLLVDPKEARRQRYRKDRPKGALKAAKPAAVL